MKKFRILALVLLSAVVGACSTSDKIPFVESSDNGMPGDAAGEDDLTAGDTAEPGDLVSVDGKQEDQTVPPDTAFCEAACAAVECGTVEGCECGGCNDGMACVDGACLPVPDNCDEICAELQCGMMEGCQCGECGPDEWCEDNVCIHDDPPPECEDICAAEEYECGAPPDFEECDCGSCEAGFWCENGTCVEEEPDCDELCAGLECGSLNGCDCGACDEGYECDAGECVVIPPDCNELCSGVECGDVEGCDCGTCGNGEVCINGSCQCEPQCDGKECGADGCGGSCGQCVYGACANGVCQCTPNCTGKECGSDGCGGSCGNCSGGDVCAWNGQCVGECTPDEVSFAEKVEKLNQMELGLTGHPGDGLDVDGNPATCAPYGDCSAGIDNSLASLFDSVGSYVDVNQQLVSAVNNGSIILLAELVGFNQQLKPFSMNMYLGENVLPKNQCNFQAQKCDYMVAAEAIDWDACLPLVTFDNAIISAGVLTAGGIGYHFEILLPFLGPQPLLLVLHNARIQADISWNAGGDLILEDGVIGGAIKKELLVAAVDDIPDGQLPISKDMLKSLLNMLITNDIDTDGDGQKDAASMGIKFEAIPGVIVGVF